MGASCADGADDGPDEGDDDCDRDKREGIRASLLVAVVVEGESLASNRNGFSSLSLQN